MIQFLCVCVGGVMMSHDLDSYYSVIYLYILYVYVYVYICMYA